MTGYDVGGSKGGGEVEAGGTGTPEERLGERKGSHAHRGPLTGRGSMGMGRDPQGIRGLEGNMASVSPTHSGPREAAEFPGLILHPPRPPPSAWVLGVWEGGGEEKKR